MSCFRQSFLKEPSVVKKNTSQTKDLPFWRDPSSHFPSPETFAKPFGVLWYDRYWPETKMDGYMRKNEKHREPRANKEGCTSKRSNLCFWNKQTSYCFGDTSFESKKLGIKNTGWFMMTFICQVESYDRRKQGKRQHWLFSGVSLVFTMSSDFTSLKAYILGRRRRTTV